MRDRDLAGALLQAAATLIAERGPEDFSLREVARRARVSEAAPYWHFPSKEALLAAVAEAGFVTIAGALEEIREQVKDPRRRIHETGLAYIRFALAHPAQLRIMFGPEIRDKAAYPPLKAAAARAFDLLVAAVADAQRAGGAGREDAEETAVLAWALLHGLSALLIDGQLRRHVRSTREALRLTRRALTRLLAGMRARPARGRPPPGRGRR